MIVMLYSDKSCEYQAVSCIKSLVHKITKDVKILYYTIGFKSDFEFKNLCKVEIPFKPEYPRFHFYKAELSLLTMHMFPGEQYVFTDTDVLFSNKFEFDKVTGVESYPLGSFGPHEYPFMWEKTPLGREIIFDEQALMRYFNVSGRTQRYLWSCFYSFNPNCKDFFEEYTSMCRNRYLLDRQKIYFPFADETAFNVCLWKRGANKNLGFAFVNTHEYETVKLVESDLASQKQRVGDTIDSFGANWQYVDDSSKVLFYHGFKEDTSTKVILEYLTHEKQGMKNRDEFGKFLLSHGLCNRGVEIGTFKADFAKRILTDWPGSLYMIDVWRALPKEEYDDMSNHENHIDAYARAIENLSGFEDRAFMLRMKGEQSADFFRDNSLDFVYIDANHTYEEVKKDIQLWYPKVKSGGVVAGHDFLKLDSFNKENYKKGIMNLPIYMWSNNNPKDQTFAGMFGVNPAVEEFCEEHGYEFKVTDEWTATWWFVKK